MQMLVKSVYVNPKVIKDSVIKHEPKAFSGCGAYIRKIVRNSMHQRRNINIHSMPGHPPVSHKHDYVSKGGVMKRNPGFKSTVVFKVEKRNGSHCVVIGGFKFAERTNGKLMPKLQEYGGASTVDTYGGVDPQLKNFKMGDIQPMRKKYQRLRKAGGSVISGDPHRDPLTGDEIVWTRITHPRQIDHQRRVYKRLKRAYPVKKSVNVPARPYMRPQLAKAIDGNHLQKFFENVVKKM